LRHASRLMRQPELLDDGQAGQALSTLSAADLRASRVFGAPAPTKENPSC